MSVLLVWIEGYGADGSGNVNIVGRSWVPTVYPGPPVWVWTTLVADTDTPAAVNAACMAAAQAANTLHGISFTDSRMIAGQFDTTGLATPGSVAAAIATAISPLATTAALMSAVTGLATTGQLTAAVTGLVTSAQLATTVAGLVTSAQLSTAVAGLVTNSALTAVVAGLLAVPGAGTTVALALNTARKPNLTRTTRVSVCGTWAWSLSLIGTVAGTVSLVSDATVTPTVARGTQPFSRAVTVGVTVGEAGTFPWSMTYDVPPGHSYSVNTTGAGTFAIALVNETTL